MVYFLERILGLGNHGDFGNGFVDLYLIFHVI
jgi:hypothetical protein